MTNIDVKGGFIAVVDDEDAERVLRHCWFLLRKRNGRIQAARAKIKMLGTWRTVLLHHLLMPIPAGRQIDHINGDPLDNRRGNLRVCSNSQNAMNRHRVVGRAPYKGVHWHVAHHRWEAHIKINGRLIQLGGFIDHVSAAKAYDEMAIRLFGEYARTNRSLGLLP